MESHVRLLRIVVASPGDVHPEREVLARVMRDGAARLDPQYARCASRLGDAVGRAVPDHVGFRVVVRPCL